MITVLTDEEAVASSDELIAKVARAIVTTRIMHPEASIEALSQVLFIVNGPDWISGSDMARARVAAKKMEPPHA
jgi:hypothetical protein